MQTGLPTTTVLPFSNVDKTQMRLNLVIMLQFLQDLSLILLCIWKVGLNIALYSCLTRLNIKLLFPEWVKLTLDSEMRLLENESELTLNQLLDLFKSQNASTWTPSQYEDLTFRLIGQILLSLEKSTSLILNLIMVMIIFLSLTQTHLNLHLEQLELV